MRKKLLDKADRSLYYAGFSSRRAQHCRSIAETVACMSRACLNLGQAMAYLELLDDEDEKLVAFKAEVRMAYNTSFLGKFDRKRSQLRNRAAVTCELLESNVRFAWWDLKLFDSEEKPSL